MAWPTIDETKPVGTDKVKTIDDAEREMRTFAETALKQISNYTDSGATPALRTTIWTTATRPTGASLVDRVTGFNSDLGYEEYYDLATTTWKQKSATTAAHVAYTPSGILSAENIQNAIDQILSILVPAGAVMSFAMSTAPTGWLKCNGEAVSRTTYAALFANIGTIYGAGDGSTTFNLPDFRGEFVRGWDDSRGVDSGRVFGSSQLDAFQGHRHGVSHNAVAVAAGDGLQGQGWTVPATISILDPISDGTHGTPRTASETRPRNVAVLFCIKY